MNNQKESNKQQFHSNKIEQRKSHLQNTLLRLQNNKRVAKIIIAVSPDECPTCLKMQGAYAKEETPNIPIEACSRPEGCSCHYIPVLQEIYP